jgi:hypothetical protein
MNKHKILIYFMIKRVKKYIENKNKIIHLKKFLIIIMNNKANQIFLL